MSTTQTSTSASRELGSLLVAHWRRVLIPALLVTAAAAVYAGLSPKSWQSSQALIVRNEAVGNDADAARSHGPDDLKNIQETIVELSKGRSVLRAALRAAGPPAGRARSLAWPSDADVEGLQKAVKIVPPKGVELGTSEVFYLEIRDKNRQRAMALSTAVCRQLQLHLQEIRNAKAQSMIDELQKAAQVAERDLQAATERLTALEKEVGSELPELRSLLDSNSSDTSLRRMVSEIENELRQCHANEEAERQLLKLLQQSLADPTRLLAAPNRLLESQPALKRLKDGLVDAQLRTAALEGRMAAAHPEVIAAREAEDQVAGRLHTELATAIRGVESELAVTVGRRELLEQQGAHAAARLERLAGLRARYTNLLSEGTNRAKLLERAEQSLANARANSASARVASLISAVDGPDAGAHPVSPAAWIVVLGGLLGGLLTGVGIVLLTVPAGSKTESSSLSPVARCATSVALVPYRSPQSLSGSTSSRDLAVAVPCGLTCAQALKVLDKRGQAGSSRL